MGANKAIQILEGAKEGILSRQKAAVEEAIIKARKPFEKELEDIESAIKKIAGDTSRNQTPIKKNRGKWIPSDGKEYPKEGTILNKFVFILKQLGGYQTMEEVCTKVNLYEPSVSIPQLKIKFRKHATKYVMQGHLVSRKNEEKKAVEYGLP